MAIPPNLRVLFFDVFGTCVNQDTSVGNELLEAAREALESDTSLINNEVRNKAMQMALKQWFDFGVEWHREVDKIVSSGIAKNKTADWRAVDKHRLEQLHKLLAQRGLIIPRDDSNTQELHVKQGSLWSEAQLQHLSLAWHRLTPWPDTCQGLDLLNKHFSTVTLSNTYNELMEELVAHGRIPFSRIYTADMFQSFKPEAKVYLGAAEKMGAKPEECGLVAAHLFDLKAAKSHGFYTIYVERPFEEKNPELREENIPDLWIKEGEGGFLAVAKRLGIQED